MSALTLGYALVLPLKCCLLPHPAPCCLQGPDAPLSAVFTLKGGVTCQVFLAPTLDDDDDAGGTAAVEDDG